MTRKDKALLKKKLQEKWLAIFNNFADEAETHGLKVCGIDSNNNFKKIAEFQQRRKYN